jgi:putative ABC transport system ATP-binding protein
MFAVKNLIYKGILDIPALLINSPVTCLVGASGSGKTTLLRMLNRLNAPDAGTVFYRGQDIAQLDTVALRREVVMLGQTPVIYPGTIEDNLQIGLQFSQKPPATVAAMKESLSKVELDKDLTGSCHNLSGGEKQRLCLARVMLMDANVYLLDEPSSALDKDTERFVIDNLAKFVLDEDKQLVMVTHSEQIAQTFPTGIIRLENGHVVEANHE